MRYAIFASFLMAVVASQALAASPSSGQEQALNVEMAVVASPTPGQEQALNVQEWTSAMGILQGAKVLIEERGWYQVEPSAEGRECISTALEQSWKNSGASLVDFDYARLAMDSAIEAPSLETLSLENDPLSTPYWGRYYVYWNDAEGRTEEEVLAAFDSAISFAEAERAAAEEAGLTSEDASQYDNQMMESLGFR